MPGGGESVVSPQNHRRPAVLALALAAVPASAAAPDYAIIARDVVPSGAQGGIPVHSDAGAEAALYDGLTPLFNRVGAADVTRLFKPETLGTATPGPTTSETPKAGVSITFDGYHVAHIHGVTYDDVTWGAGWDIAEQRGLLLQQARYDSLVAAIDAPGLDALGLVSSLKNFTPSAQTNTEVAKQTNVLLAHGAKGRAVLHDIDVYLAGINAYFAAHGGNPHPFTRTDIYAFNALKDQFVGEGGGDEAVRSEFLSALRHKLGAGKGSSVWNDLRESNDPEAPVSVPGRVRFQAPPRLHRRERQPRRREPRHATPHRRSPPLGQPAAAPRTPCWSPALARPPTTRSWSPGRRSATSIPG